MIFVILAACTNFEFGNIFANRLIVPVLFDHFPWNEMLILLFMWQVGDAFNSLSAIAELNAIASKPESDHVFRVDSFGALDQISSLLEESIVPIPGMDTFFFLIKTIGKDYW